MKIDEKESVGNIDGRPEFVPAGEYEVTIKFGDWSDTVMLTVNAVPGIEWARDGLLLFRWVIWIA